MWSALAVAATAVPPDATDVNAHNAITEVSFWYDKGRPFADGFRNGRSTQCRRVPRFLEEAKGG
jgi:hypothetical protein